MLSATTAVGQYSVGNWSGSAGDAIVYIERSREKLREGAVRREVLDALTAIAQVDWSASRTLNIDSAALHALDHLAKDHDEIREYLHRFIERLPPAVPEPAYVHACRLLVNVANEESRRLLLRLVEESWEKTGGGQYMALELLGDARYAAWLERTIRGLPEGDGRRPILKSWLDNVKIQHDEVELLNKLSTPDGRSNSAWYLRVGVRKGVSLEKLTEAAKAYLKKAGSDNRWKAGASMLRRECQRLGLLDFGAAGQPLRITYDQPWPKWATRPESLAKNFWKEARVRAQSPQHRP